MKGPHRKKGIVCRHLKLWQADLGNELVKPCCVLVLAQLLGSEDVVGFAQHRLLIVRLTSNTIHKSAILSKAQQNLQDAKPMQPMSNYPIHYPMHPDIAGFDM